MSQYTLTESTELAVKHGGKKGIVAALTQIADLIERLYRNMDYLEDRVCELERQQENTCLKVNVKNGE